MKEKDISQEEFTLAIENALQGGIDPTVLAETTETSLSLIERYAQGFSRPHRSVRNYIVRTVLPALQASNP
jgi:hypothetical protein